ncbi:MAG: toll/interleukin-1 receptor domain-containing protein [Sphingomicrobium sp.]
MPNEYFRAVILEVDDENDPDYQRAIPFSTKPAVNPETLSFWKPGQIPLFITHRDHDKVGANELADALSAFGISSFVAHDTIKPMKEWRREILKGLDTMEMMLVYLTDQFAESIWTQQEVGFALGKDIPVISLKLQGKDPPGFIDNVQAQRGSMDHPANSATSIYKLISEQLVDRI